MNELNNIQTQDSPHQKSSREADHTTRESAIIMDNFGKILLSICGVLMAALVMLTFMVRGFVEAMPQDISANKKALYEITITQRINHENNRKDIDLNTASNVAAEINSKGTEKALIMLSSEVKHLGVKVGENNAYWREFNSTRPADIIPYR